MATQRFYLQKGTHGNMKSFLGAHIRGNDPRLSLVHSIANREGARHIYHIGDATVHDYVPMDMTLQGYVEVHASTLEKVDSAKSILEELTGVILSSSIKTEKVSSGR